VIKAPIAKTTIVVCTPGSMLKITPTWPVGDEQSARQPLLAVLGDRRQCDAGVRESGTDFAEETAQTGPKGTRPNRYSKGDEHDQQGVFGRRGAPFVAMKMFDQAAESVRKTGVAALPRLADGTGAQGACF
jgi:hypothetical protein